MNLDTAAIVALGSNLGDSAALVRDAMARLEAWSAVPLRRSSLWQSAPVDCPPGSGLFTNAVVALAPRSGETPESLLDALQGLERAFGRPVQRGVNDPRVLDLDLIVFGAETRTTARLTLPHPRAGVRRFVLGPLAELAPDLVLPGQRKSVVTLLRELAAEPEAWRLG